MKKISIFSNYKNNFIEKIFNIYYYGYGGVEMKKYTVEVCVDSVESSIFAEKGGANRLELCDSLVVGGTTPSKGLIELVLKNVNIDVFAMIRPRGGDFCYSNFEFETMKKDIELCKELGVQGVVLGILCPNGEIDKVRTKELVELASPMEVTFHRAFDMTVDPIKAIEDLISINVTRILTSGHKNTAMEGINIIKKLQEVAGDRIKIMAGAGVSVQNSKEILNTTKIKEIHLSAKVRKDSEMQYRNLDVCMGGGRAPLEYENYYADEDIIRSLINNIEE